MKKSELTTDDQTCKSINNEHKFISPSSKLRFAIFQYISMITILPIVLLAAARLCYGEISQLDVDTNAWVGLPNGGISGRPFITDISASNNGTPIAIWAGATSPANSPPPQFENRTTYHLTAIVSPVNMCVGGNTANCYATPNRVSVYLACQNTGGSLDANFYNRNNPCNITTSTVVDITINLNTFTSLYQWSWMNGNLAYWSTTTNSAGQTLVRFKFSPVLTPIVDYSSLAGTINCCTCDVPSNCNIQTSTNYTLAGNMFFHCQGSGLTGSVFATQKSIMGALAKVTNNSPQGSPSTQGTQLQYTLVSSHLAPDNSTMKGSMTAFIPMSTLTGLYPGITSVSDATAKLSVSRTDSTSSGQDSISIVPWNAATNGGDGVAIIIQGVTFSTPNYVMGQKSSSAPMQIQPSWITFITIAILLSLQ